MQQRATAKDMGVPPLSTPASATRRIPPVRWASSTLPVPPPGVPIQPQRPAGPIPPVRIPPVAGAIQQPMTGTATQGKLDHAKSMLGHALVHVVQSQGARRAIQRMQAGPTRYFYNAANLPQAVPQEGITIIDYDGVEITIPRGFFKSKGSQNYIVYSKRDGTHWTIKKRAQARDSHLTSAATAERRGAEDQRLARSTANWKNFQQSGGIKKSTHTRGF